MNIKELSFKLRLEGKSFKQIATQLGIGKTTVYNHVKEIMLKKGMSFSDPVPNGSELGSTGRSERNPNAPIEGQSMSEPQQNKQEIEQVIKPKASKVFTGDELVKKKFQCLEFEGKFLELIGKPEKFFSAVIWGLPKGGKSNLAIRLADYLEEYFGRVLYIAAEEGESVTLQQKIKDIGGSKMKILETRDKDEIKSFLLKSTFDFVFIDSINVAGIESEFLELLKNENPSKSFVAITQATKSGNFKGDQSLTHNCDFIIKVVDGIAYQEGRFSPASEVNIFEKPLYQKNKKKIEEFRDIDRFKKKEVPKQIRLKPFAVAFPEKEQNDFSKINRIMENKSNKEFNYIGLFIGTGVFVAGTLIYQFFKSNE